MLVESRVDLLIRRGRWWLDLIEIGHHRILRAGCCIDALPSRDELACIVGRLTVDRSQYVIQNDC